MKKKTIIFILIFSFLVISFYSCRKVFKYLTTDETAENIQNTSLLPEWFDYLPESATNISYWKLPCFCTTYEYEVSEQDFLKWAEDNNIPLTNINDATEITRYYRYVLSFSGVDDPNQYEEYESKISAVVKKGYEYHIVQDNGGGSHVVYDTENQKAYHDYPHR